MARKVLFVCTGNTCRSAMAEALARGYLAEKGAAGEVEVASRGLFAPEGGGASEHAVAVMEEMGLDLSAHRARRLLAEDMAEADLVLAMTEHHKEMICRLFPEEAAKVFTLAEFAGRDGDVPDPFGGTQEEYRRCALHLKELVEAALKRWLGGEKPEQE
ncbi:low molecular weight protein arginine phosphatase [Desulfovirgula thermocuniculi]|uniref:low molecular weight protein arginine phosphatase n=1 Tax=Desulfovirgula thermocuniculi TaxID=348842 RepID=UPI00041FF361|nr:low molecular weight protein arginine phosphatase [Desulfovirgula thermocuniculi]